MKQIITLILLLAFFASATARPVNEKTAKAAAQSFLRYKSKIPSLNGVAEIGLQLAYKPVMEKGNAKEEANYFYVFNAIAHKGFVIVAGDDNATPILAYSGQENFDAKNIPVTVVKWLEGYKTQLRAIAGGNTMKQDASVASAWQELLDPAATSNDPRQNAVVVAPLVQTRWDQSPYYNALCPYDNQYNERTVSGCVATAMTQIMKFWNYPANGAGFHSYNTEQYGTLSANFGATTYNWAAMPNVVNSANNAVAVLTYQVGVSVDMNYGVGATGGSGAYVVSAQSPVTHCSEYALKTYFDYDKTTVRGVLRASYTDAQWRALLRTELDAGRPVLYAGFGGGGGHCFVADGYDDNNMFHFNWGWGGNSDGYFAINALNPGALGTGGGSGGFNSGQQAVIGIKPTNSNGGGNPGGNQPADIRLYDNIDVTSNNATTTNIGYGNAFSVTTSLANFGTTNFPGDYCAAMFDAEGNFVEYVDSLTGTLVAQTYAEVTFETSGLFSVLPGDYRIGIFFRPMGGQWVQVANGNYANLKQVKVVNANAIEMNSAMTITPGTVLTQGQPLAVRLNLINKGSSTFYGKYDVSLYNLDGSFVQTVGELVEDEGLPPNFTYLSPYLPFSTPEVTAPPGTYLLAVQHLRDGAQAYELVGSTSFSNPIKVTVQAAAIQPDIFEVNNTAEQARLLPATFNGNSATVKTTGSNCHTGSDYDFYKVELPAGYNYTISARLHDSYSATNGISYSLDALFSDSSTVPGSKWSEAYDDVMPGNITLNGGGTLYFKASPFFTGQTGTYLLDIAITRVQAAVTIYTFTGNGSWADAANWQNGQKPPAVLETGKEIIIDPLPGGECVLNANTPQTISPGAKLTVRPNARFRVAGNMNLQ